jgi:hypothetical protein
VIDRILEMIPDSWLLEESRFRDRKEHRAAYREYLLRRLESPRGWLEDAVRERTLLV